MRIRPHCLFVSFLLIFTLIVCFFISTLTNSPRSRRWALFSLQTKDLNENTSRQSVLQTALEKPDENGTDGESGRGDVLPGKGKRDGEIFKEDRLKFKSLEKLKLDKAVMNDGHRSPDLMADIPDFDPEKIKKQGLDMVIREGEKHDKWIVLTTVSQPTSDVIFLANITGWKVVVVGDTKTPKDWSHPNCIFLSVSKQLDLGLATPRHLPYKHYARKNVGYLYAIAHGADVIYETDDDNRPLDRLQSFEQRTFMSGLMYASNATTFNPYRHFGQPTLWPRGFPLSQVGSNPKDDYRLSPAWPTPVIQQGLVNGDPDMDAVFRLTRKITLKPLTVTFDPVAPPAILPAGIFSPFNSQNTLFLKNALWALLIPTTTTFRICDIWRGYWAQRLLWEIGGNLGFLPPNAYQQRNAHSYMADYKDEEGMYFDTDRLLEFLSKWTCPDSYSFFQCIYKLSFDMATNKFWREADVSITRYWLEDLIRIGYPEPKRHNATTVYDRIYKARQKKSAVKHPLPIESPISSPGSLDKKKGVTLLQGSYVQFVAADQPSPQIVPEKTEVSPVSRQADLVAKLCPGLPSLLMTTHSIHSSTQNTFNDVLLIIVFNWPYYANTRLTEIVYRPLFPNIIYCGFNKTQFQQDTASISNTRLSFVEIPKINGGFFSPWCAVKAMEMNYKVKGYLVTNDDVLLNVWNFRKFDKNKPWMDAGRYLLNTTNPKDWWMWWSTNMGSPAYSSAMLSLNLMAKMTQNGSDVIHQSTKDAIPIQNSKAVNKNGGSQETKNKIDMKRILPDGVVRPEEFLTRLFANTGSKHLAVHAVSDVYYIPSRLRKDAVFYLSHFLHHNTFVELCVPLVLHGLQDVKDIEFFKGVYLYMKERENPWAKFNANDHLLHPIKLSSAANLGPLCTAYFPLLLARGLGET